MPMYFPDLKSIQNCVNSMRMNKGDKKYAGVYPETEEQLPEARKALAKYFRNVWGDEVQALEVELGVAEDNYDSEMKGAIWKRIAGMM